ncbi:hypothetical protein CALVIDRAFT_595135 [Calocera viscosa TUFC12733]|uniref:Ricin B lectin domain-containing protein n=1 Tax=Calocera viscosa (strain TUFC12733) TaxID=1330018 RepID=A0A167RKF8_CALVF|nr:hypothetical protein CALVIDRAFT_595135 [Calocera viscosa TUFC12733]
MLGFIALAALSLAAESYAAPLDVGIITCGSYSVGALDYSSQTTAPLGGYRTTVNSQQQLTVDVMDPACSLNAAHMFEFQICNSTFMDYAQTPSIHYGIVKDVASGQCLVLDNNVLTLEDCWYSDDSGQVLQYFALGGPVSESTLTLVRKAYDGTNALGEDLVPTAPPSPLADFPVSLQTPGTTVENVLYLETRASCT